MERKAFQLYTEYIEHAELLSDEDLGKLFRAILQYVNGIQPSVDGAVAMAFSFIKARLDSDTEKYNLKCEANRENGKNGGRPKIEKNRTVSEEEKETERLSKKPKKTERLSEKPKKPDTDTDTDTDIKKKYPLRDTKKKYGEYGWVKLTDDQYDRLEAELGVIERDRCIRVVDELAQQSGNKNGYKDWNLVVRKCARENWGKKVEKPPNFSKRQTYLEHAYTNGEMARIAVNLDGEVL